MDDIEESVKIVLAAGAASTLDAPFCQLTLNFLGPTRKARGTYAADQVTMGFARLARVRETLLEDLAKIFCGEHMQTCAA